MKNLIELFSFFNKKQKLFALIIVVLLFIGMIMEMFSLYLIFPVIEFIVNEKREHFEIINNFIGFTGVELTPQYLILILIFVFSLKSIYFIFITYTQHKFINSLYFNFSVRIYENLIKKNYNYFLNNDRSFLMTIFQIEIPNFMNYVVAWVNIIVEAFISISVLLFIFIFLFKEVSFIGFILFLSVYLFYTISKKYQLKWGKIRSEIDDNISKIILETFSGIKELIINQKNKLFFDTFKLNLNSKARISVKYGTISNISRYYLEFILVISLGLYLLFSINFSSSSNLITNFSIFVGASFRLLPSINKIINFQQQLKYYNESFLVLKSKLMITKENLNEEFYSNQNLIFKNSLEININSKKTNKLEILFNNFWLKINKGECIGIYGESGVGKSTFANILAGIESEFIVNLKIDGNKIIPSDISYRKLIGYVTQETFVFDKNLKENITLSDQKSTNRNFLKDIIRKTNLTKLNKNKGEDFLGQNGKSISGGEKQRIGIARSLYRNAQIIIFDEPTSALDIKTEAKIISLIESFKSHKTLVIISHKKEIFKICDRIYQMRNGKLFEN